MNDKVASITKSYRIEHLKADFKLKKTDDASLKWLKTWKKITHPFAKKSIPVYVNYRELAEHYIKNHQIYMLQEILADFELWSYKFIHDLKVQINKIDNFIDQTGQIFLDGKLSEAQVLEAKALMLKDVAQKEAQLQHQQNIILQTMLASFRREIVALGYKLEEINANKMAKNKQQLAAIASKGKKQILDFPDQWYDKAVLYFNKLNADLIMTSFKNRTMKLVDDYRTEIDVYFHKKIIREIKRLKSKIQTNASELEKIRALKVDISIDTTLKVFNEFEQLNQEVMKLVDVLPKEMMLPSEDDGVKGSMEQAIVPISKISRHFFESRFVGQVADRLEKTEEAVVRLVHEINDQMNLTRFSIDNLDDDTGIGLQDKDQIINEMMILLDEKTLEIEILYGAICQQFENAMEEAFDPLASYKIIESSKVFTTQLRGYQSRRIKDILGYRTRAIGKSVMKQLARVWYTKSEGVLLAKRLMETENLKSRNEKILDIVERASPKVKVMNSIPHYYKSLFSGRSNISDEFWVEMKPEQEAFLKAIERYRQGSKGGILITGERNCGKTNLCQHVLKKQFKENLVFHLFPPIEGSTDVQDFAHELAKVSGIHHPKSEIYETLPFGSVIAIHDMELWWERSPSGLGMIMELLADIDKYSKSYLFVINMNVFAYELINNVLNLQDHLIGVVRCQPFDSENLKTMIMKRHASSGLSFVLENKVEESMSQLKKAKLFSQYFDFTNGNPGVTLNAWLSNIVMYKNEHLFIKYPTHIDTEVLNSLEGDAVALLQQTALHKRMDLSKMMRVFGVEADTIQSWLRPLRLNGLISEKSEGVFVINPFVEPFVVKMLKQKELL
ncbi:MAG: ATP-binding protein [Cyclobacteriaceae bacterium]|nr:ATP-binding protein [Cyclobacteriaceae bacterium]